MDLQLDMIKVRRKYRSYFIGVSRITSLIRNPMHGGRPVRCRGRNEARLSLWGEEYSAGNITLTLVLYYDLLFTPCLVDGEKNLCCQIIFVTLFP